MQPRGKSGTSSSSCKGSVSDLVAATGSFCFLSFRLNFFFEALSIFGLSPDTFVSFVLLECGAMSKNVSLQRRREETGFRRKGFRVGSGKKNKKKTRWA